MNQELQELYTALKEEHMHAKNEFMQKSMLPFDERVALGMAFPSLPIKNIGEETLTLRVPTHVQLHNGIEQGDMVSVFPPSAENLSIEGICSYMDAYSIEILIR